MSRQLLYAALPTLSAMSMSLAVTASAETLIITADNYYDLYVNGVLVGSQNNADGAYGWDVPESWEVTLQEGANVIAVFARDESPASASGIGLIVRIDGPGDVLAVTDDEWRVAATGAPGWEQPGFDDSAWGPPLNQGPYDTIPWTLFQPAIAAFAGTDARWLWRDNPPYAAGYGYYNGGQHQYCFFRRTLHLGTTGAQEGSWGRLKRSYR